VDSLRALLAGRCDVVTMTDSYPPHSGDYARHCDAARAIAEREFAAEKVLSRLLTDCGLG